MFLLNCILMTSHLTSMKPMANKDVEQMNAAAVMEALRHQNEKLQSFQEQLSAAQVTIRMLQQQLGQLQQANMEELCKQFGTGSTQHTS